LALSTRAQYSKLTALSRIFARILADRVYEYGKAARAFTFGGEMAITADSQSFPMSPSRNLPQPFPILAD